MAKGILYVETRPASPDQEDSYHAWYEGHMRELMAIDGFVAARRFAPVDGDGPFVAIYEIESARARLAEAVKSGKVTNSPTVLADPPPVIKVFREIAAC